MRLTLIEMTFSASIVILVVTAIRTAFGQIMPKRLFPLLWLLLALRLLIPFSIPVTGGPVLPLNMLQQKGTAYQPPLSQDGRYAEPKSVHGTVPSKTQDVNIVRALSAFIWLTGSVLCALFFLKSHRAAIVSYRTALPITEPLPPGFSSALVRRTVQIKQSDQIDAPLTYGLLHPVILLPKTMTCSEPLLLSHILTHELAHIRSFDILLKWLFCACLCVHWFNPIVWLMYYLANRDIELSCDEKVLRHYQYQTKSFYAKSLIALEETRTTRSALCSHFSKNPIEERIGAIMKTQKISKVAKISTAFGAAVMVTAVSVSLAVAAAASPESGQTAVNQQTTDITSSEYAAEFDKTAYFKNYESFGLKYNEKTDELQFNGKLVRYFEDYYSLSTDDPEGLYGRAGYDDFNPDGIIDVHAVRNFEHLVYNEDGSYDPSGILTGVEAFSQQEFDQRDLTPFLHPEQYSAIAVSGAMHEGDTASGTDKSANNPSTAVADESGEVYTPEQLALQYSIYEPYGVTYDKEKDQLYYNGEPVKCIVDIFATNGESPSGGHFEGVLMQNFFDEGTIELQVKRDYNKTSTFRDIENVGKLLGVEVSDGDL